MRPDTSTPSDTLETNIEKQDLPAQKSRHRVRPDDEEHTGESETPGADKRHHPSKTRRAQRPGVP